jgi:flagellar motor protein MotB
VIDKVTRPIVIVKRRKSGDGGHHGGAWKVAYADFVTAMMAFFLVMWLVTSVGQGRQWPGRRQHCAHQPGRRHGCRENRTEERDRFVCRLYP